MRWGVGLRRPICCEPVHVFVEVWDLPPALLEAIVQLRFGFAIAFDDSVTRQMGVHRESQRGISSLVVVMSVSRLLWCERAKGNGAPSI
jgi:hypothetical protein